MILTVVFAVALLVLAGICVALGRAETKDGYLGYAVFWYALGVVLALVFWGVVL